MKEVSTISKRKSRSRPQNRRQQPRPVNKGYGDAGASWHKKATKGFRAMSGSPKEDIDANNYTLRQRARMLYMAAPIATSAIRTNRTNVVGIGLQLKSRIDREALGMTQEAADAWQAQAEREFALWSENKRACDATGVNNFAAMQQLALSSWLVSGDVFAVVKQYEPTPLTPYSLRLHLIEADRVATPTTSGIITPMLLTTGKAANGNTIYDGVEVNGDGQIEAYHIRSTYPLRARQHDDNVGPCSGIRRADWPAEHPARHGERAPGSIPRRQLSRAGHRAPAPASPLHRERADCGGRRVVFHGLHQDRGRRRRQPVQRGREQPAGGEPRS